MTIEIEREKLQKLREHAKTAKETQDSSELHNALNNIDSKCEELLGLSDDSLPDDPDMCPGGCGREIPSGCQYACSNCWHAADEETRDTYRERQQATSF